MTRDKLLPFKILSVISLLISLSIAYFIFAGNQLSIQLLTPTSLSALTSQISELSTDGYVEVKPEAVVIGDEGVVSLAGSCYRVTAGTDAAQAESILNGIEGKITERPNAHDLMKEIFEVMNIQVLMVKIVDIKPAAEGNANYLGRLIVKQGDNVLSLDSRPSDGIALAVRTNSTIYFKESLMKERGQYVC